MKFIHSFIAHRRFWRRVD